MSIPRQTQIFHSPNTGLSIDRVDAHNGKPIQWWLSHHAVKQFEIDSAAASDLTALLADFMARPTCSRCEGCGLVSDSDDAEPWTAWMALPPGADLAVRAGIVNPVECPVCGGTGMKEEPAAWAIWRDPSEPGGTSGWLNGRYPSREAAEAGAWLLNRDSPDSRQLYSARPWSYRPAVVRKDDGGPGESMKEEPAEETPCKYWGVWRQSLLASRESGWERPLFADRRQAQNHASLLILGSAFNEVSYDARPFTGTPVDENGVPMGDDPK